MDEAKVAFLSEKCLAVVGVSQKARFGNVVFRELRHKGYRVYPVSRTAEKADGERCFRTLDDLPEKVGGVVAVVPPIETEKLVADCARLGIRRLWMQQGAESAAAIRLAEERGLAAVHGACVLLYADPKSVHRFHAWVWRLLGKL